MDRLSWSDGSMYPHETLLSQQNTVKLYDGEDKTEFEIGTILLTSHRMLWKDYKDQSRVLCLAHSQIMSTEEQPSSWSRSPKVILRLHPKQSDRPPGPFSHSKFSHIKLSFAEGGHTEFNVVLRKEIAKKAWESMDCSLQSGLEVTNPSRAGNVQGRKTRAGIVGIERKILEKHMQTDTHITLAFEDLGKLMEQAKHMVGLSKTISDKIKARQGDITEDETVKFKSYLLSLGISDPVTRDTHGGGNKYYQELAKQITTSLQEHITECGGIMTLSDVYCRINRARGMELLSPEDLVCACREIHFLQLPLRMHTFDSGVMVLQLATHNDQETVTDTTAIVEQEGSLTAEELASRIGLSVVLSKERLLSTEKVGCVCRDECVEGLRFYPNLFVTKS